MIFSSFIFHLSSFIIPHSLLYPHSKSFQAIGVHDVRFFAKMKKIFNNRVENMRFDLFFFAEEKSFLLLLYFHSVV